MKIVVTCEHGGPKVPKRYAHIFRGHHRFLESHRGFDRGALQVARDLALTVRAPLVASTVTRLLVDLNRSHDNSGLHWSKVASRPESERLAIVDRHWRPHRTRVEELVRAGLRGGHVLHIGSHSFTPKMRGSIRRADIGVLFDPSRVGEARFAKLWMAELRLQFPNFVIAANSPYAGTGDGLTTYLRSLSKRYLGIELEINQKRLRDGEFPKPLRGKVSLSLATAVSKFNRS